MKQKITLKSLGKELGVSVSTVSKALNNSPEISEETRERVQKLARLYNYRPNAIATNLRSSSSKAIAVIVPDLTNGFFAQTLEGMEEMARSEGYKLITCISHEESSREDDYLQMFSNGGVDGFLVAISEQRQRKNETEIYDTLVDEGMPIVMFDRVLEDVDCDKIVIDDRKSGSRVVEFLFQRGARKFIIASTIGDLSVAKLREQGIRQRTSLIEKAIIDTIYGEDTADLFEQLSQHLKTKPADAIIALDQIAGLTALNAARDCNLQVPEDIQVVGYSDGQIAQNTLPRLTVVDQHAKEIGRKAVLRMINLIRSQDEVQVTRVHTVRSEIIERESTKDLKS